MRCSRCDQPVVPQAMGRTPEGRIVFGWCLNCLEDGGCVEVEVARTRRRPTTRLVLRERDKRPWLGSGAQFRGRRAVSHERLGPVRQLLKGVAAIMTIWGCLLLGSGLVLARPLEMGLNPAERSIPHLIFAGGGTAALAGAILWIISTRLWDRSQQWLRGAQAVFFGVALVILGVGVATHDPKRDPWIVAAAAIALVISALARWVEIRSPRLATTRNRGGSEATKTKAR